MWVTWTDHPCSSLKTRSFRRKRWVPAEFQGAHPHPLSVPGNNYLILISSPRQAAAIWLTTVTFNSVLMSVLPGHSPGARGKPSRLTFRVSFSPSWGAALQKTASSYDTSWLCGLRCNCLSALIVIVYFSLPKTVLFSSSPLSLRNWFFQTLILQ